MANKKTTEQKPENVKRNLFCAPRISVLALLLVALGGLSFPTGNHSPPRMSKHGFNKICSVIPKVTAIRWLFREPLLITATLFFRAESLPW